MTDTHQHIQNSASDAQWQYLRDRFPNQWVLLEAYRAYTDEARGIRVIPHIEFIDAFGDDWIAVWKRYRELHELAPEREYIFYHTANERLEVVVMDDFRRLLIKLNPFAAHDHAFHETDTR